MKLRALIVDDEFHARENLRYLLQSYCPEIEVVGTAADAKNALEQVNSLLPQVLFLDICMPSGTEGFDFLESIPEKKFQVVFVTAFKDYAIRALNANAIHYLQKPVDVEDLKLAVKKICATQALFSQNQEQMSTYIRSLENISRSQSQPISRITISHPGGFKIVDQKDFMYLVGDGPGTIIVFTDGTRFTDTKSIAVFENMLDSKYFLRIHSSHIINLTAIKGILHKDASFVLMNDDVHLAVSPARLPRLLDLLAGIRKSSVT